MSVESLSNVWRRRHFSLLWAAMGLLASLLAAGCGGVPKTYYYGLQVPALPAASDPRTDFVLGVERFRAPELLRDDRIVYYHSPTELNYYEYHRWGSDPASMLSEITTQWINGLGIFAQVRSLPAREPVDYVLAGRVFSFEEVDYKEGGKARVSLELNLLRSRDRKVVWSARRLIETALQGRGVPGVASALNSATEQLLREALPGLVARVEQDFRASQGQSQ